MTERDIIVVPPAGGRRYELAAMRSRFLADGEETGDRYCVSEWWLEAGEEGPGPHSHEANEELFYVLEGTMTFLAGDDVVEAPPGTFLRIPAGVVHDFRNAGDERAGALNVFMPGGFEPLMRQWTA
jgi:mannose-6-phosphate isomerase-like protein (cupin superfamily)